MTDTNIGQIAVMRTVGGIWIIYGSYKFWPSQCFWLVPGTSVEWDEEVQS